MTMQPVVQTPVQIREPQRKTKNKEGQTWGWTERDECSMESWLKANAGCLSPSRPIYPYGLLCPLPWGTSDSHKHALVLPTSSGFPLVKDQHQRNRRMDDKDQGESHLAPSPLGTVSVTRRHPQPLGSLSSCSGRPRVAGASSLLLTGSPFWTCQTPLIC